jgi:hypothetical protein
MFCAVPMSFFIGFFILGILKYFKGDLKNEEFKNQKAFGDCRNVRFGGNTYVYRNTNAFFPVFFKA